MTAEEFFVKKNPYLKKNFFNKKKFSANDIISFAKSYYVVKKNIINYEKIEGLKLTIPNIIDTIFEIVRKTTGLDKSKIKLPSREKEIVFGRSLAFFLISKYTPLTLSEIGVIFTRPVYDKALNVFVKKPFNHSTIIHSIEKIEYDLLSKYANQNRDIIQSAVNEFLLTNENKEVSNL